MPLRLDEAFRFADAIFLRGIDREHLLDAHTGESIGSAAAEALAQIDASDLQPVGDRHLLLTARTGEHTIVARR